MYVASCKGTHAHTYNTHYKVAEMQKTCRDANKDPNKVMWDEAFILDEENPLRLGCVVGGAALT